MKVVVGRQPADRGQRGTGRTGREKGLEKER